MGGAGILHARSAPKKGHCRKSCGWALNLLRVAANGSAALQTCGAAETYYKMAGRAGLTHVIFEQREDRPAGGPYIGIEQPRGG